MTGPVAAILLTVVVHFLGAIVLIWAMAGKETFAIFRTAKDDGDGGIGRDVDPPVQPGRGPAGGLPLPDAEPAPVRLREPGRIGEGYPRRPRRPQHAPAPARERETV